MDTVSAWPAGQRIVLGQRAGEEKSNEITAIPLLLKSLDLTGALGTIDAMGPQKRSTRRSLMAAADYVPSLKENWPETYAEVKLLLNNPPPGTVFEKHQTADGCNGRIATRRHTVCYDVGWMMSDRRYPGEPKIPGFEIIGRVETAVERGRTIEYETRYYLCSIRMTAEMFGRRCAAIEGSRTGCTGFWTSCSAKTSPGRELATPRRTWTSSDIPPFTCYTGQNHSRVSRTGGSGRMEHRLPRSRHSRCRVSVQEIRLASGQKHIDRGRCVLYHLLLMRP